MTKRDYLIEFDGSESRALRFVRGLRGIEGANEIAHKTTETGMNRVAARFEEDPISNASLILKIVSRAQGIKCIRIASADVPDGETRSSIWDPTENVGLLEETRMRLEGTLDPVGDLWDGFPGIER